VTDIERRIQMPSNRDWIASLPADLERQQRALSALLDFCEQTPDVSSFSVGCSLGRHAADRLSDVDAAIGVNAERGAEGVDQVRAVERALVELLPTIGELVDVLRRETADNDFAIRHVFAQFADRLQLDLALVAEAEVRRGDSAPDFVPLHWTGEEPTTTNGASAYDVSDAQLEDWVSLGWRALLDADKYLQRRSLWEAHHRLHEARTHIWRLWAAAHGASYPWHGLSQVLDHNADVLPEGIEGTVAQLDAEDLRRAVIATADVLDRAVEAAAARGGQPRTAFGDYVRRTIASTAEADEVTPTTTTHPHGVAGAARGSRAT
jgi:predicted nucleotidyltransferase